MEIKILRKVDSKEKRKYVKVYKNGKDIGYLIFINDASLYRGEIKNPRQLLVCDEFISCNEERIKVLEEVVKDGNIISWARFKAIDSNRPYYFKYFRNRKVELVFEIYN